MRFMRAAALALASWSPLLTQSYAISVPHDFARSEGRNPVALLQASDGAFFGVASQGGLGHGTVFELKPNGQITRVHRFLGTDGATPNSLIQARDQTLYGTTLQGGNSACPSGCGTVFHIDLQGNFSTLYAFSGPDGQSPANLLQGRDGNFYGTSGGAAGPGAVFKLTPGGTLSPLYEFCSQPNCADGSAPASLIQLPDGDLAGVTLGGGPASGGVIFRITLSGTETVLVQIYAYEMGNNPRNLVLAGDGAFYFTVDSDPYGSGRVLRAEHGGITLAHQFDYTDGNPPYYLRTGRDGNVYGASASGGTDFMGTVFEVSVSNGFSFLYSFNGSYQGATPTSVLLGSDGSLYGTTAGGGLPEGGCVNCGTVFELQ